MNWKRAIDEELAVLGGIVALLFSLADLAERTASRSPLVASLVLWFLRQAEAVARDFVDAGSGAPSASMPIMPAGAGPLAAMRLAVSLRALARQIEGEARMLRATRRQIGRNRAASPSGLMPPLRATLVALSSLATFAPGAPRPAAPDTS